ncbi:MAG TPA: hypothetical protein VKZ49_03185, partial [Polyangiaceae bacterium]|nr:hypothetical protein [Polyangiaceae bacterium]
MAADIPPLTPRGLPNEEELFSISSQALAKAVDDRYESAQAMLKDLEGYVSGSGLIASPLRFGRWLSDHFGTEIVDRRRERERAARAIEAGPLVELSIVQTAPETASPGELEGAPPGPPLPRVAELPPRPTDEDGAEPVIVPPIEPPPASLQAMVRRMPRPALPQEPPAGKSASLRLLWLLVAAAAVLLVLMALL